MKTIIAIPCYNESKRLLTAEFLSYLLLHPNTQFVFVNDGSTDNTTDVLNEMSKKNPNQVLVLQLPHNQGKAEAVRQAMTLAINKGANVVGFWDADLATPLIAIDDFLAILSTQPNIQWVFGARVQLLGHRISRHKRRHYSGRVFATATSFLLRLPVYDTQCGAKLFRVNTDLKTILKERFISRWIFDVEMIARLKKLYSNPKELEGLIYEYPLKEWTDIKDSKIKLTDFFKATVELCRIGLYLNRK